MELRPVVKIQSKTALMGVNHGELAPSDLGAVIDWDAPPASRSARGRFLAAAMRAGGLRLTLRSLSVIRGASGAEGRQRRTITIRYSGELPGCAAVERIVDVVEDTAVCGVLGSSRIRLVCFAQMGKTCA
jgi:hypothetical protein